MRKPELGKIADLYDELNRLSFPGGIPSKNIAIHAEITSDAAYNIMRFLGNYFNEEELNLVDIRINEDLSQRLDYSIEALTKLRDYKNLHDELAKALIEALRPIP
jgi:hypothetical protein